MVPQTPSNSRIRPSGTAHVDPPIAAGTREGPARLADGATRGQGQVSRVRTGPRDLTPLTTPARRGPPSTTRSTRSSRRAREIWRAAENRRSPGVSGERAVRLELVRD
jgi:hypothetical protein